MCYIWQSARSVDVLQNTSTSHSLREDWRLSGVCLLSVENYSSRDSGIPALQTSTKERILVPLRYEKQR
jgi:hypothetical protein